MRADGVFSPSVHKRSTVLLSEERERSMAAEEAPLHSNILQHQLLFLQLMP